MYIIHTYVIGFSFILKFLGGGRAMTLSANSPTERDIWMNELEKAAANVDGDSTETSLISRSLITSSMLF